MKSKKWSTLLTALFTYLAIAKIIYWISTISAVMQSGLENAWAPVLNRILEQDLLIIIFVVIILFLDKLEYNVFLTYAIGYVVCLGIIFGYSLILGMFFELNQSYFTLFLNFTVIYVISVVILTVKHKLKEKSEAKPNEPA